MSNLLFDTLIAPHANDSKTLLELADGTCFSYAEMVKISGRMANLLSAKGVVPGDRVAVQVEKSPQALALYFACVRAGAVFLPLNTAYTASEVSYFVGDAKPKVLVCDPAREEQLTPIASKEGANVLTLGEDGTGSLSDQMQGMASDFATCARSGDDLAAILYTSGTTGRSKGAMLTQSNLLSNALVLREYWRFGPSDVLLHALPIFHTHGLFVASNVILACHGSMIFLPRFDLETVLRLLPRATTMMGVPTFYTRLLDSPKLTKDLVDHIRLFISGSAPLLAETHVAFEGRTGKRILERYGMTETNMNTSNPYDGVRKAGTVGFPLPGVELKITDPETGATLNQGEIGLIEVRGPNVFCGYWQMPEKTAEELRADGFFITGDLGMIDADGYVVIVGRAKDLIISGGFNIYPKEIESLIDDLDGVVESAVFGVPHPDFGEGVVAAVVPQKGAAVSLDMIKAALAKDLAKFKQPKHLYFVDALPRNTMGKVQKNILREEHKGLFQ